MSATSTPSTVYTATPDYSPMSFTPISTNAAYDIDVRNLDSLLIAPDVARLPERAFQNEEGKPHDLRTAFTDDEIVTAERTVAAMTTYEDLVDQAGKTGSLFGAANPGRKLLWPSWMREVEVAEERIGELNDIHEFTLGAHTHHNKLCRELFRRVQNASRRRQHWIRSIEDAMDDIRIDVRNAHLTLRNLDYRNLTWGKVTLGGLSKEEKEKRRGETCRSCNEKNHRKTDHIKRQCPYCKYHAPHHYAWECPEKPDDENDDPYGWYGEHSDWNIVN